MPSGEIVHGPVEELASTAHEIITSQEFDYFDSATNARAHVNFEGLNPLNTSKTELGYTKVPRIYSDNLNASLGDIFHVLNATEAQDFVHIDRYGISVGRTSSVNERNASIDLVISPHRRSCSLQLQSTTVARFSAQPKQGEKALEITQDQPAQLSLGKNILQEDSFADDHSLAIHNSFRDWERVLIVGESAIRQYMNIHFYDLSTDGRISHEEHAARIGQVGTIRALEKALSLDTDFGSLLIKRNKRILNDPLSASA